MRRYVSLVDKCKAGVCKVETATAPPDANLNLLLGTNAKSYVVYRTVDVDLV
jgi:hypothetical protein